MERNHVEVPAATKLAVRFIAFFTVPVVLLAILVNPLGSLVLCGVAAAFFAVLIFVYVFFIRLSISITRRLAYRADIWFARKRAVSDKLNEEYCLLLRSTIADAALSIDDPDRARIKDPSIYRIDIAPSFRSLIALRMQPFYTVLIKNSEQVADVVSLTYNDAEWQKRIEADMDRAKFLLLLPHWPSPALRWEMHQIKERGLLGKTFLVMPPAYVFRPADGDHPHVWQRLADRLRYGMRETFEAIAPLYFVGTRHRVALEEAREAHARDGWESASSVASEIGLQLPPFDPRGAFFLGASLLSIPEDASILRRDAHRIEVAAGVLDWSVGTTGAVLASVASGRGLA